LGDCVRNFSFPFHSQIAKPRLDLRSLDAEKPFFNDVVRDMNFRVAALTKKVAPRHHSRIAPSRRSHVNS
jgi:hypothetical protein